MSLHSALASRSEPRSTPVGSAPMAPLGMPLVAPSRPSVGVDLLLTSTLLRELEPPLAQWLAQRSVVRRYIRHGMVTEQGSREAALFVLLKGQAQAVRHNSRGRSLVIDHLRPGDHFGELSVIDDQPQTSSVRCLTQCDVLVVHRADFVHCLSESQTLLPALLKMLVKRVRRSNRRIALLALNDVRGCVVQQLIDLADEQDGQRVVQGRISRQAVADMIGASRAMVSRVMMALTRAGEIELLPDGSTLIHCSTPGQPTRRQRRSEIGAASRAGSPRA